MAEKTFEIGDPGLPQAGILLGRGGGISQIYFDLTANAGGETRLLHYQDSDQTGRIPPDHSWAILSNQEPGVIRNLMNQLNDAGFWETPRLPPQGSAIRYIVMITEEPRIHYVIWAEHEQPYPEAVHSAYEKIKSFLVDELLSVVK